MREIIFDTETTGLLPSQGHRIVEIGAVEMQDKVLTGKGFHFYINPERDMPPEAYRVHGISAEFLKDKPLFKDIADEFLAFIGHNARLVAHNAEFDMKFINYELSLVNKPSLTGHTIVDTLQLARTKFPGTRNSLDALCRRFGISLADRQLHGALKDSELLAEVYVELQGGRQAKFMVDRAVSSKIAQNDVKTLTSKTSKVVAPSAAELENHKKFMDEFCKNSLWTREK